MAPSRSVSAVPPRLNSKLAVGNSYAGRPQRHRNARQSRNPRRAQHKMHARTGKKAQCSASTPRAARERPPRRRSPPKTSSSRPSVGGWRATAAPGREYGLASSLCARPQAHRDKNPETAFPTKPARLASGEQDGGLPRVFEEQGTARRNQTSCYACSPSCFPLVVRARSCSCNKFQNRRLTSRSS